MISALKFFIFTVTILIMTSMPELVSAACSEEVNQKLSDLKKKRERFCHLKDDGKQDEKDDGENMKAAKKELIDAGNKLADKRRDYDSGIGEERQRITGLTEAVTSYGEAEKAYFQKAADTCQKAIDETNGLIPFCPTHPDAKTAYDEIALGRLKGRSKQSEKYVNAVAGSDCSLKPSALLSEDALTQHAGRTELVDQIARADEHAKANDLNRSYARLKEAGDYAGRQIGNTFNVDEFQAATDRCRNGDCSATAVFDAADNFPLSAPVVSLFV